MTEVAWRMFPGQLLGRFEGSENPAVATVFSLLNTPGGALWAGLREGIVTYQYLRWKKTSSVQDADLAWFRNQLWHTGEDHYLFCHQAGTWHPVSVPFAWCRRLQVDSVGYLWALPREGLWRSLDGQQWEQIALPWPKPFVHNLSIDTANTLWMWIHGQSAIYHWADGQIETLPPPRKAKRLNEVITLRADTRGRLWFGTRAPGVWWWDGTIWNQVSIARHAHETGLIGALAQDLCIDHEDRIWVATERGIACCIAGVWHPIVIALEAPLPDRPVPICPIYTNWYRLHLDLKGRLWLGSGQFGEVAWIDTRCDPYPNSQEYRIEERRAETIAVQS